jgi:hypothetical protein
MPDLLRFSKCLRGLPPPWAHSKDPLRLNATVPECFVAEPAEGICRQVLGGQLPLDEAHDERIK